MELQSSLDCRKETYIYIYYILLTYYVIIWVLRWLGCCGLGKNEREKAKRGSSFSICRVLGSVRTELMFLVSGSKFSHCMECWHKMSVELEVFTSLSMIINLAWLLNLWHCCWKYQQASIALGSLVSFLCLFNLMVNVVSAFPTYYLLQSVHSIT